MTTQQPTTSQIAQSIEAQRDFEELFDRLVREGFDYRSILAGASSAIARSITASAGAEKVSPWFAANATLANGLTGDTPA